MVKGINRQVIVVHATDEALFDQAIFLLKDNALKDGVSDDALLREAKKLIHGAGKKKRSLHGYGLIWACGGALLTGIAWLLSALL